MYRGKELEHESEVREAAVSTRNPSNGLTKPIAPANAKSTKIYVPSVLHAVSRGDDPILANDGAAADVPIAVSQGHLEIRRILLQIISSIRARARIHKYSSRRRSLPQFAGSQEIPRLCCARDTIVSRESR